MAIAVPRRPEPEPGDVGTIYLSHGGRGALGYSLGEGDDAYVHWRYGSDDIEEFPYVPPLAAGLDAAPGVEPRVSLPLEELVGVEIGGPGAVLRR